MLFVFWNWTGKSWSSFSLNDQTGV
jgi:hypothetical protein